MRGRRWMRSLLLGALGCHIALVVAGAAHLTSRLHGPVGRGLRFYEALSGAGDSYSFFAPTVGPQLRARFALSTPGGARSEETLEAGKSREVGFRLGNLAGTIYVVAHRTDLRRAFLGALAASRFGAHPEVSLVQVNIEEWVMPTMGEYRLGARPRWRSLLDATFVRTSRASHAVEKGRLPTERQLVSAGVGSSARGASRGVASAAAPPSVLALRRSPLPSRQ
jgi:hypothetical protein